MPKPASKARGSDVVVVEESELEEVMEAAAVGVVDAASVLAGSSRRCKASRGAGLWSNNILPSTKWPFMARL